MTNLVRGRDKPLRSIGKVVLESLPRLHLDEAQSIPR